MTTIAIVIAALVLALLERRPDPIRFGAPGTWLALFSGLALLATTVLAMAAPDTTSPFRWLGLPLVAAGIALRLFAMRALGPSFTSERVRIPGRRVLTRGIYGKLRHPSDAGLVLYAAGIAVLGGSGAAIATVALAVVPSVALRVLGEERMLRGAR